MNIRPSKTITIVDPREFDGDAYQVATRAIQQLVGFVDLVAQQTEAAALMARNAELERLMAEGIEGDQLRTAANNWPESPQGRLFAKVDDDLTHTLKRLRTLEKAVAYDPKAKA